MFISAHGLNLNHRFEINHICEFAHEGLKMQYATRFHVSQTLSCNYRFHRGRYRPNKLSSRFICSKLNELGMGHFWLQLWHHWLHVSLFSMIKCNVEDIYLAGSPVWLGKIHQFFKTYNYNTSNIRKNINLQQNHFEWHFIFVLRGQLRRFQNGFYFLI